MTGQPSPWAGAFRGFDDWDEGRQKQLSMQFMQAAAPLMQDGKVVPKPNDDEIHLRGAYGGYPMRVRLDAFYDLEFEVKAPNGQHQHLTFMFDPDSAPTPGDVDPWDDDDEVRVFLAKCVYVEDSASEIDAVLRQVQRLPQDFKGYLFPMMQQHRLSAFNMGSDGPTTGFRDNIGEMWDPILQLQQVLWLLGYAANVYTQLPAEQPPWAMQGQPGMAQPQALAPVHRVQCRYCSTVFMLDQGSMCPNCGAPFQG